MKAKKRLGQNFLRDAAVARRIVNALDLSAADTVVEIGPGTGALTEYLIESDANVIAVEFDRDLIAELQHRFCSANNFSLINADALRLDLADLGGEKIKIAANLPYNIATPILQQLAGGRENIAALVLMFQREVVDRIIAEPATSPRGYLSVLAQNAFEAERLFDVPPSAFSPVPKVWSSVVRLTPKQTAADEADFLHLVSVAFAHKRKTLLNNLKTAFLHAADALAAAGIDASRRAETLTLEEWRFLFAAIKKAGTPS